MHADNSRKARNLSVPRFPDGPGSANFKVANFITSSAKRGVPMALPNRVPPPPDRNERLREEQVEFESKRPGGLAIAAWPPVVVVIALLILAAIMWLMPRPSQMTAAPPQENQASSS